MRNATVTRKTKETKVNLTLNIDGSGKYSIKTPIKFLNHMLELFAKFGGFDLKVSASGDIDVDQHHLVEDIGITLGQAFRKALGSKKGIQRSGYFVQPMDESLAIFALDVSGRPFLKFNVEFQDKVIGDLKAELVEEFFQGFTNNLGVAIHILLPYGRTDHHRAEAVFKAFGKALDMATAISPKFPDKLPSTKGKL
ncbi:MAG TPA: imidazoleglycerol-phosphate dehydratase HisB [Candidatus Nanoarchaeia archaeon]|nr:imidazoleglycerol-phosphate dehydratase HisB [Candidatus Nanoarchaeia archaeon]